MAFSLSRVAGKLKGASIAGEAVAKLHSGSNLKDCSLKVAEYVEGGMIIADEMELDCLVADCVILAMIRDEDGITKPALEAAACDVQLLEAAMKARLRTSPSNHHYDPYKVVKMGVLTTIRHALSELGLADAVKAPTEVHLPKVTTAPKNMLWGLEEEARRQRILLNDDKIMEEHVFTAFTLDEHNGKRLCKLMDIDAKSVNFWMKKIREEKKLREERNI